MTISVGGTNYPFVDATGVPVSAEAGCVCCGTPCPADADCPACATPTQCVLSGLTGVCAALNGTYALTRDSGLDPGACIWSCHLPADGGFVVMDLRCSGGNWILTISALSYDAGFAYNNQWVGATPVAGPCPPVAVPITCANGGIFVIDGCPGVSAIATLS